MHLKFIALIYLAIYEKCSTSLLIYKLSIILYYMLQTWCHTKWWICCNFYDNIIRICIVMMISELALEQLHIASPPIVLQYFQSNWKTTVHHVRSHFPYKQSRAHVPGNALYSMSILMLILCLFLYTYLAVDCGDPGTPTNGQRNFSSTTYNSVVTYTCDVGYTLQGSNSRNCLYTGQWKGSVPHCIGKYIKESGIIM